MSAAHSRSPLIDALMRPRAFPDATAATRLVETHISWVLLTGRYAYKIKKPIELPFLDFSSLERRRRFCVEELRLNRRLAPELYLDVVPIGGTPEQPRVAAQPAIEYAVKMLQFPDDARLDRRLAAGGVAPGAVADFAGRLADFHRELPELPNAVPPSEESAIVVAAVRENLRDLQPLVAGSELAGALASIAAWTDAQCTAVEPVLARRLAGRAQRECHGDLHLENLLIRDGRIAAFDALEFDPKLREIDVISEASFVAMDLLAHGRADLAYVFLTAYFEAGGDYDGIEVLRFYLVYRAMIRAKVRALQRAQTGAAAEHGDIVPYFGVATGLVAPHRPLLVITHGLSASGKTHLTSELVGTLQALRVRSDLERKRMHGLASDADSHSPVGGGLYGAAGTARTYDRLLSVADTLLRNGFHAIVDATFLRRAERQRFAQLARAREAGFAVLDCAAPPQVLRARIEARGCAGGDASEAKQDVLEYQLAHAQPLSAEEQAAAVRVDTDIPLDRNGVCADLRARGLKTSSPPPR